MIPFEEWRSVVGMEKFYEISSLGRIKSKHSIGRNPGGILSPTPNKKGYLRARLVLHGKSFTKVVHRLVLEAFVGPQPSSIHESNHKNGIKNDNRLENLEWLTPKENNAHSVQNGFWHPNIGEAHGRARLSENDVQEIRRLLALGHSCNRLGKAYGVSHTAIRLIRNGVNWKHVKG